METLDFEVPDVPVEYASVSVDKMVVVLDPEVLEDLVHGLHHRAVKFGALDWFERADLGVG